jgi:hypothetical protein
MKMYLFIWGLPKGMLFLEIIITGVCIFSFYFFAWLFILHFFDLDFDEYLREKGASWARNKILKRIEKQNLKQCQHEETIDIEYEEYNEHQKTKLMKLKR